MRGFFFWFFMKFIELICNLYNFIFYSQVLSSQLTEKQFLTIEWRRNICKYSAQNVKCLLYFAFDDRWQKLLTNSKNPFGPPLLPISNQLNIESYLHIYVIAFFIFVCHKFRFSFFGVDCDWRRFQHNISAHLILLLTIFNANIQMYCNFCM